MANYGVYGLRIDCLNIWHLIMFLYCAGFREQKYVYHRQNIQIRNKFAFFRRYIHGFVPDSFTKKKYLRIRPQCNFIRLVIDQRLDQQNKYTYN